MYRLVAESHGDRCRPNPLTLLNGRGQGGGAGRLRVIVIGDYYWREWMRREGVNNGIRWRGRMSAVE